MVRTLIDAPSKRAASEAFEKLQWWGGQSAANAEAVFVAAQELRDLDVIDEKELGALLGVACAARVEVEPRTAFDPGELDEGDGDDGDDDDDLVGWGGTRSSSQRRSWLRRRIRLGDAEWGEVARRAAGASDHRF